MINTKTRTKEDIDDTSILISDIEVAKKLINIYQSSQDRKLEFNLSFEYVKKLLEYKTCYYTNVPFTEDGPYARSFDRVESDKGYIEGNVVACTVDINGKKANLTYEEISCLDKKLNKPISYDINETISNLYTDWNYMIEYDPYYFLNLLK